MGFIGQWLIKRALKQVMKKIQKDYLSEEQVIALAKKHRRQDEDWLYAFATKPQTGWRAKTEWDDRALLYVQARYRSRYLDQKRLSRNGN